MACSIGSGGVLTQLVTVPHEGADQPQQGLMFWVQRSSAEELTDVNIRDLTARGVVRLVSHEYPFCAGVPAQQPAVSVCTAVEDSSLDQHWTSLGTTQTAATLEQGNTLSGPSIGTQALCASS